MQDIRLLRYLTIHLVGSENFPYMMDDYNDAIAGCEQGDSLRTREALKALRSRIQFDHVPNIASGLWRLYEHCDDLASEERFDQTARILKSLHSAWCDLIGRQQQGALW